MASIHNGKFIRDDMTSKAMGGTELLAHRLVDNVPKKYLRDFQIHISRTTDKDESKRQLLWVHDLANDPAVKHLANEGWKKYEKIIFVSHWQQEMYNLYLGVPYHRGAVIRNAIEPLTPKQRNDDKIRLIYTSTPHRGLSILYPVFEKLAEERHDLHLDVFSSFGLYGWHERDRPFESLFQNLKDHDSITYHGAKSNDIVRKAVESSDIFVLPSIWPETSCLSLIEAMSAGLICVHSSLAALSETSMGATFMYDYTENMNSHAQRLYNMLNIAIDSVHNDSITHKLKYVNTLIDENHSIERFRDDWVSVLKYLT